MKISFRRWLAAQEKERELDGAYEDGNAVYDVFYRHYFDYLGILRDQQGKSIIEVGSGPYPALMRVDNIGHSLIVDPIFLTFDKPLKNNIRIIVNAFEFEKGIEKHDELWMMNVLQHVIDPDRFIAKAKKVADVVRFFEPINHPTSTNHPHTFTLEYFQERFGQCTKLYQWDQKTPGFHTADCAYGIYKQ